jgi:hypothetical protein
MRVDLGGRRIIKKKKLSLSDLERFTEIAEQCRVSVPEAMPRD